MPACRRASKTQVRRCAMPLFNLSLNEDRTWLKTIRLILACLKRWILSMDAFAGRPLILLHLHDFSILLIVNKQPFSGPFPGYVPISVLQSIGRNNFIAGAGQIPSECQLVILVRLCSRRYIAIRFIPQIYVSFAYHIPSMILLGAAGDYQVLMCRPSTPETRCSACALRALHDSDQAAH